MNQITLQDLVTLYGPIVLGAFLTFILGLIAKWFHDFVKAVKENTIALVKLTSRIEFFEKKVEMVPIIEKDVDEAHKKIRRLEHIIKESP